jgi:hypothetical protein
MSSEEILAMLNTSENIENPEPEYLLVLLQQQFQVPNDVFVPALLKLLAMNVQL